MQADNSTALEDQAPAKRLWQLSWPIMLSNASVPLLGLVDTAVVGHLDDSRHLAAVALGASAFSLLFWAFGFLRMGTTATLSQAFGRRDGTELRLGLAQAIVTALCLGLLMILLQLPLMALLKLIYAPGESIAGTVDTYLHIRIWSAPATLLNYVLLGSLLALQQARAPVLMMLSVNLTNIVLDAWLGLGLGWNSAGVAAASVIAEYVGSLCGLWLVMGQLKRLPGAWPTRQALQQSPWRRLFKSHRDLFIRTLCLLGVLTWMTRQGSLLGANVLAANAILLQGMSLTSYVLDGFAQAVEALTGAAWGQQNRERLTRVIKAAAWLSGLTALGWTLLFAVAGLPLAHLLTSVPEVLALIDTYLPWLILMPLVAVWSYLFDGLLIGTSQFRLMRDSILLASAGFILCWYCTQSYENSGLWLAYWVFFIIRTGVVSVMSLRLIRRGA
ncbi:MATE family efflux transporter [Pokkaliibacter sp. CJK22405]|uniref:MATE family efflux transporter n=1 Tax=Pokkaliibacter sp. CJK22405 TaxID=3384615 RepID=UPI003984A77F